MNFVLENLSWQEESSIIQALGEEEESNPWYLLSANNSGIVQKKDNLISLIQMISGSQGLCLGSDRHQAVTHH